jgi:hypothetical protein
MRDEFTATGAVPVSMKKGDQGQPRQSYSLIPEGTPETFVGSVLSAHLPWYSTFLPLAAMLPLSRRKDMASGTVGTLPENGVIMQDLKVPPAVAQGQEAFRRDLPQLLEQYRGQWVAYRGPDRIAVGKTQEAAYQQCLQSGKGKEDFVVLYVEPGADATTFLCHSPLSEGQAEP